MGAFVRKSLVRHWGKNKIEDMERISKQTPAPGVHEENGIAYLPSGHAMHTLNLYWPEGAQGSLPTVIDIHGGGWMYGDRELNKYYCMYLASKGYAVMGMSYRLLPETDLRGQVQDIFASLHWLERNAGVQHLDLDRVLLTGDSAGGHLAGLVACVQLSGELRRIYGVKPLGFSIGALALVHSVCDVHDMRLEKGIPGKLATAEMHRMMFGKRPKRAETYKYASFRQTAEGLALPPVMLISSEPDELHPQTLVLERYLKERGAAYTMEFWKREQGERLGHVFNILYPEWPESRETNDKMLAFFIDSVRGGEG